ncbi:P-loop containing nucleoside triphosphate hydrolase protein [Amylostereum chailletii]|nr:P-loop containing nucleoside triphosphate hydrolase protein [Amylostereum chailletii]
MSDVPSSPHEHPQPGPPDARPPEPILIVVMGVSGCGKSTLGKSLAAALAYPFIDADDLHPPANVAKMSRGEPLTDADRAPWLVIVRDAAVHAASVHPTSSTSTSTPGVIVACSALKRAYRAVLRDSHLRTYFVHPHGSRELLLERMTARPNHFMKAGMLDSQLAALEDPLEGEGAEEKEEGVLRVPLELGMEEQVKYAVEGLERWGAVRSTWDAGTAGN